jgi:hypothetical protein
MRRSFLLVIALLCLVSAAWGDVKPVASLSGLTSNEWKLSFTPKNGIDLSYKGVNLIRRSDLDVYHGQYTSSYFNYLQGTNKISISEIAGGKRILIEHISKTFKGTQTITLLHDKAIFRFDYGMPSNVTDGLMDYCFGYISAQPFVGRAYTLRGPSGERSGTIPAKAAKEEDNYAPDFYNEAVMDSNVGKVHIKLDGELRGLMMRDFRYSAYTIAGGAPVFWSGIWNVPIEAGRTHSETVTLSIDPAEKTAATARKVFMKSARIIPCKEVKSAPGGELRIVPLPKQIDPLNGYFNISADTRIVVADDAGEKDLSGAELFAADVRDLYGIDLKTVRESEVDQSEKSMILIGTAGHNKMLDVEASSRKGLVPPAKEEGYALQVTPNRIFVLGYDQAGTFYGMQSLRQLLLPSAGRPRIHDCSVIDWPSLKFRGILLFVGKNALPFHEKLIDRVLTKYKYNALVLECDYLQWKTNPKMAMDFAMSQDDLKKDIAYARKNFLEPIPLVQSLGHCEWAFKNGQNTDIVEDPAARYAFCPSNPKTYDFLFSVFDEAIELFDHPRYFHIGHDEVAMTGKFPACPVCTKKSETELLLMNTNNIHDYLSSKDARVMMWGDMLLGPNEAIGANNAHTVQEAVERRAGLPKDIVIADWHYYPASPDKYPSLGIFKKDGFDTLSATWDDPENISNFTLASKRENIMGHLLTLWVGYDSSEENLKHEKPQFDIIPLAGDYAWNTGDIPVEMTPYKTETLFDEAYYRKKPVSVRRDGFCVGLQPLFNVKMDYSGTNEPRWISLKSETSPAATLSTMHGYKFSLSGSAGVKYGIRLASASDACTAFPRSVTIPVNASAGSLIFLHTAAKYDDPESKAGVYRVHYEDGSSEDIPIIFGKNIGDWNDSKILPDADIVWAGKTGAGDKLILRAMEWKNPHPGKKIASIEAIAENTEAGITLLGISGTLTVGDNKPKYSVNR